MHSLNLDTNFQHDVPDDSYLRFQPESWTKLPIRGKHFKPRSGHDMVCVGKEIFIFGGNTGEVKSEIFPNDLRVLDIETLTLRDRRTHGIKPEGRASFAMCKYNQSFLISGGTGRDRVFGDMFLYDVFKSSWTRLWPDVDQSPCKYYGQSMCCYGDSVIFFGGSTGQFYSSETYIFHIPSRTWQHLSTSGEKPSPRYQHTANIIGDTMVITGGGDYKPVSKTNSLDVFSLCLKTLHWSEVQIPGSPVCPRASHTATYDEESGFLYVGGGFDSNLKRLEDHFKLNINEEYLQWSCITEGESLKIPKARAFHGACISDGALLLFGGADGARRFNDVWQYRCRARPPSLITLTTLLISSEYPRRDMSNLPSELLNQLGENCAHSNEILTFFV